MAVESTKSAESTKSIELNLEHARKKDKTKVKGIFIFHEVPGGKLEFPFKKYKHDPIVNYSFIDGEEYEIPLEVAKHLCTNCWYPNYSYKEDERGRPVTKVTSKIRRCSFQSLEFLDIDGIFSANTVVKTKEDIKD